MLASQDSVWANSFAEMDDGNVILNPGESIYFAFLFEYPESIENSTYPGLAEGTIKLKQTISADFVWEQAN